jgi:hypothetical protein
MSSGAAKRVSSHPTKNPVAPEATGFRPMQLGCDLSVLGHQDRPWAAEATRLAAPCSYFRVSASNTEAWASTIPRGVLSRSPQSRAPSDRLPILARRATKNLSAERRPCDWVGHEGQHLAQAMFAERSEHSAEISLVAAFWVELAMTDGRWRVKLAAARIQSWTVCFGPGSAPLVPENLGDVDEARPRRDLRKRHGEPAPPVRMLG